MIRPSLAGGTASSPGHGTGSTRPLITSPPRVIVGFDGSWSARAALHWAARYARATGSVLQAVRVLEWPIGFTSASTGPAGPTLHVPDSELDQTYRHGLSRIFAEADPLPGWTLSFAEGPTAQTLVQLADDAELLVLGSHVRATSGDARTGELGRYCTNHASRPVVIVPVEYLEHHPPVSRADRTTARSHPGPEMPSCTRLASSPPSPRQRLKARALARWDDDGGQ